MAKREMILPMPDDPYRHFLRNVPRYVSMARLKAQKDAFSYRKFHVGSTLYAVSDINGETTEKAAGNLKVSPNHQKVCAEKKVTRRAEKDGMTFAVGYIAVGTTDRKLIAEVTGHGTPTLHCCADCLDLMSGHYLTQDHTLVVTAGLDKDIHQVHTLGQMKEMYQDGSATDFELNHAMNSFDDWTNRVNYYDSLMLDQPRAGDVTKAMFARIAMNNYAVIA
jgi:cytidine deaminase